MPKTNTRRRKIEQPLELQPSRPRMSRVRRTSAVLLLVVLGGCSTALQQCFAEDATRLTTSGSDPRMPQGCVVSEIQPNGLAVLECEGGREGFVVPARPGQEAMQSRMSVEKPI